MVPPSPDRLHFEKTDVRSPRGQAGVAKSLFETKKGDGVAVQSGICAPEA